MKKRIDFAIQKIDFAMARLALLRESSGVGDNQKVKDEIDNILKHYLPVSLKYLHEACRLANRK